MSYLFGNLQSIWVWSQTNRGIAAFLTSLRPCLKLVLYLVSYYNRKITNAQNCSLLQSSWESCYINTIEKCYFISLQYTRYWFIRNAVKAQLVLFLIFSQILTSFCFLIFWDYIVAVSYFSKNSSWSVIISGILKSKIPFLLNF